MTRHLANRLSQGTVPVAPKQRGRRGWTKVRTGFPGSWRHDASGWTVHHCGHPTALWPYYALPAGVSARECCRDQMLLTGGFGLGLAFRTLALCQAAVEARVAKGGGA